MCWKHVNVGGLWRVAFSSSDFHSPTFLLALQETSFPPFWLKRMDSKLKCKSHYFLRRIVNFPLVIIITYYDIIQLWCINSSRYHIKLQLSYSYAWVWFCFTLSEKWNYPWFKGSLQNNKENFSWYKSMLCKFASYCNIFIIIEYFLSKQIFRFFFQVTFDESKTLTKKTLKKYYWVVDICKRDCYFEHKPYKRVGGEVMRHVVFQYPPELRNLQFFVSDIFRVTLILV